MEIYSVLYLVRKILILDSYIPTEVKPSSQNIRIVTLQHTPGNHTNVCKSVCKLQNVCPLVKVVTVFTVVAVVATMAVWTVVTVVVAMI